MAAGFFISKTLGIVGIVLGIGAVATIIALSVVYSEEKNRNTAAVSVPSTTPSGAASTTPPTSGPSGPQQPWNRWRLPDSLKPLNYTVTLQPFLEPNDQGLYIFKGNSTVIFQCQTATNLVLLHSKKLNYTSQGSFLASLQGLDGAHTPAINRSWLEPETEYLVLTLMEPLVAGRRYQLFSTFVGELADDLAGFYRSEYMEGNVTK